MGTEVWVEVQRYPKYEISSFGRFRNKRYPHRFLKTFRAKSGYVLVSLYNTENKLIGGLGVARLMALSFIERSEGASCVNHKNGIKHDNRTENLEWVDVQTNLIHAIATGLKPTKISKEEVSEIIDQHKNHLKTQKQIAHDFSIDQSTVSRIINKKSRFKTSNYDFVF